MKSLKRLLLLPLLLIFAQISYANDSQVEFRVNSPMLVSVGETFRVEFSLSGGEPERNSFKAPSFGGLEVLAGPSLSTSSSIQIINGSMTRTQENSYTYVVVADSASTYNIGAATIRVDGREYKTKRTPIEVVKESASRNSATSSSSDNRSTGGVDTQADAASRVASDDILLRMDVSRKNPYQGEPIRATLKLYSRVAVVGSEEYKMPSYNGFWKQDIVVDNSVTTRETYNGKVYDVRVLSENLLYPQQSGELTIEPASMVAIAQVVMQSRGGGNPFFGGREVYNVKRRISTPEIKINVKPLPAGAPASFSGAVGRFTIESSISSDNITANSAVNYNLRLSGEGNLSFVQAPNLDLPASFELYSIKSSESINTTRNGSVGYKQYDYPFIVRTQGVFEIPKVEFSYFDPKGNRYVTLSTDAISLDVAPDAANGGDSLSSTVVTTISKGDVKMLGQDIRFIKIDSVGFGREYSTFILTRSYYLAILAIVAIFIALYIAIKQLISSSKNMVLMRGKRANKVAIQRFKSAKSFMTQSNERAFYEEMHRALWGYMGDKLNIPVAILSREGVREELIRRGATAEQAARFSQIITKCDEAQYSPAASAQMGDIYVDALDFISRIETQIKK
ncbi:MAG: BatD family protein [Rikenellaceae bacterium]